MLKGLVMVSKGRSCWFVYSQFLFLQSCCREQQWGMQDSVLLMRIENSQALITIPWISFQLYRTKFEAPFPVSCSHIAKAPRLLAMPSLTLDETDPLRCFFAPSHHYALALAPSHAIIWPYSVATSTPSASETFTVSIPETCRDTHGAVPLGVLLSTATGEHPGLLVIIPSTGRIIYWETVSSAASLGLSGKNRMESKDRRQAFFLANTPRIS